MCSPAEGRRRFCLSYTSSVHPGDVRDRQAGDVLWREHLPVQNDRVVKIWNHRAPGLLEQRWATERGERGAVAPEVEHVARWRRPASGRSARASGSRTRWTPPGDAGACRAEAAHNLDSRPGVLTTPTNAAAGAFTGAAQARPGSSAPERAGYFTVRRRWRSASTCSGACSERRRRHRGHVTRLTIVVNSVPPRQDRHAGSAAPAQSDNK